MLMEVGKKNAFKDLKWKENLDRAPTEEENRDKLPLRQINCK